MTTAADFIKAAQAEVGYHEMPAGSNKTKYAAEVGHPNGQPWCATFVVAMARRAGVVLPGDSAYTPAFANAFKAAKQWFGTPEIGDVVFYDFPGGHDRIEHVGIVIGADAHNVTAIEGNTSSGDDTNGGAVQRRHRSKVNVVGYGRPEFTTQETQVHLEIVSKQDSNTVWLAERTTKDGPFFRLSPLASPVQVQFYLDLGVPRSMQPGAILDKVPRGAPLTW